MGVMKTQPTMLQKVKTWLIEALGGSAVGGFGMNEDDGWRPVTERVAGKSYRRDLNPLSQAQQLKIAHFLYTGNGLAQFIVNIPVALCVGRSVDYTLEYDADVLGITREKALDEAKRARRFLDPWWEHPAHDFKGRAARYCRTYLVTGELLLVIPDEGTNPTTNLFQLDYIDSALIHDVAGKNGLATTPGKVIVNRTSMDPITYDVMLPKIDGTYDGECFFYRHTGRLNSLRGVCFFLAQADWIDLHDQILFAYGDKTLLANTLVHDLTIQGAQTDAEIKKWVDTFTATAKSPGGVFGHNEKVTHEIKTADLENADNDTLVRRILLHVLGSKGFPEHWFADAGGSNRASSGEQTKMALQVLEELQEELLGIFRTPLNVAYDRLAAAQNLPARETGGVRLYPNLPKISEKDITAIGGIIDNVESALDVAVQSGRISRRTARIVSLALVEKLCGEHPDADDEAQQVEIEREETARIEQERANAAAKAAADLAKQLGEEPDRLNPKREEE